jgi:hypothetical protein
MWENMTSNAPIYDHVIRLLYTHSPSGANIIQ